MKIIDLVSLSVRSFKTNTSRTILTILGLGVGVGTVFFLVSLGYGLQNVILNSITTSDSLLTLSVSPSSDILLLNQAAVDDIKNLSGVEEVSPSIDLPGQLGFQSSIADAEAHLVDSAFFRLNGTSIQYGGNFSDNQAKEIIISSAAAMVFGFTETEEALGQNVNLSFFVPKDGSSDVSIVKSDEDYRIVGIVKDENSGFFYAPLELFQGKLSSEYSSLKVKVASEELLSPVREEIVGRGFLVSSISDTISQTKNIFSIIQIVLGVFGLAALIVSAIGMFNTMTIALLERTKEIGIMRAVGVSHGDVARLFLMESLVMGFLGGLSGITIGFSVGKIFNWLINTLAENFGGQSLDLFYYPIWFVVSVVAFSMATGFLTGIYPARRAAKLNPLEALRYK